MNKVYRLIWSSSHNAWVVTSEITKSRGKRSCKALLKLMPLGALLPVFALAQPPPVDALPTGGQVVAGQASMAQSGNTLNINQGSQRAAIDWQGFNIGSQATVNFQQPSSGSVALNRVVGGDASQVMGNLNANGQVFITNPNGVIFGRTASVNVGGLVATTHSITNEDFMAGDDRFTRDGATGSVINEGQLSADLNGYIALLAPEVRNEGVIVANMGTVALAAGEAYTLQLDGNRLTGIQVEPATLKALVDNKHAVQAPGGLIILSARAVDSLQGGVVKNSGVLQASSLTERGGVIRLEGDHIALDAGSELIATGATGGGQVLVGGDWQGSGDMHQATTVTMEQGAKIDVSATQNGDGGKAVLWSDLRKAESVTTAKGSVLAKGGAQGGNGGKVETSASTVEIDGFKVDTLASEGEAGLWLIDPYDYNINAGEAATIANALNSSSVTISTSTNVSEYGSNGEVNGNGDININSNMIKHGGAATTLTLSAARNIRQRTGVTIGSDNGLLNMDLQADSDKNGDGIIFIEGSGIGTRGGNLTFGVANQYATINGASVRVGGDVFFQSGSLQTVYTGGGALNVYGEMIVSNTSGLTINSEGGNVNFNGLLNSGNAYTFISKTSGGSWDEARTEAKGATAGGSGLNDSYLVNITSRLENSIAGLTAGYKGAWIGAYRADSTKFDWSYANGPEAGQVFFTQNSSGGGSVKPGYYANFGSGEPNGKANTDRAETETVGQFFGSAGSWNDLTHATTYSNSTVNQYAVTGFVRETNLADSPITITAGSGVVSFNGGVGASKALASLNVTAVSTVVNGNALITTGTQNYSSSLTVNAGNNNFNLGGTGITTGGAASFSAGSITTVSNGLTLNTGANNLAIMTDAVANNGNKITLNSTGTLTYAPLNTNWTNVGGALNFNGSTSSGNFTGGGDVVWLNINNIANLRGLTLGKANNTSGISIDTAVGIAGPIALYGSDISINAGLTTTGSNTITLKGTGNVTDGESGYVSASNLLLLGGNVALDNASNSIGTLAASGVGSLTYVDNNALTIGSVGSTSGINATGTVSISTLIGDLTVSQNINTSNATANALELNAGRNTAAGTATGGNLILTGSPTITVGSGGTAKLYTGSVSNSTGLLGAGALTSGSGRFRYGSDETTTNYTKALSTGLNVIYRERPSATVVVAGKSMTYGDALVSLTGSVTGALNGDVASYVLNNRVNSSSGNIKAGSYTLSETALAALGYNTTVTTNTLSVGQKTLILNNFAVNASKVYDGSKTATISNAGNLSVLVGSDVVTAANSGATYDNKNVGTDKTVTLNGVSITSTDAANYTIANTATTTANITAAPLTVTATTVSKTYDGNTSVTEKGQVGTLEGAGAGEVVNSSGTQAFIDKNVGTNKTVQATGVTIKDSGNADVTANYAITYIANAISAINRLNSVTWIGGATGNWFDPANWAGGAVPDLSNVANVVIPNGVTVTFDTTGASGLADVSGPVNIDQLGDNAGSLVQANGQLKVGTGGILLTSLGQTGGTLTNAGTTVVDSLSQSGGSFSGTGNMTAKQFNQTAGVTGLTGGLTVTQNFSQGNTGSVTVGASTQITDTSGGVQLGNLTSTGALTVNSTGGAITQATGTALIASLAGTFSANNSGAAANITLANASNNFGGLLNASGANITLKDIDALVLGAVVSTGDLTVNSNGNLTMGTSTIGRNLSADTGNGNISQTGALSVTGSSTLNSGTGNTTFTNTANDFVGSVSVTGQDINLVDANGMSVALTATGDSGLVTGVNLAVSGTTQNLTTTTNGTGTTSFGATTVAGNLAATSAGAVSQTGALEVTGTADFMAAGQDVTLSNADNNFAGVVSATAKDLSLADLNGITLGAVTTTGTLGVAAVGDIIQTEGTRIAAIGETTLVSTGGSIALANATNDFSAVNASGTQVSLVDANGMSVALTATGNSSLAAGGDLAVSGTTQNLSTTTTGAGATSFGTTSVAGNLAATSAGAVSQTGVLAVTGTADFMAAGQDVTLSNADNNFAGIVSATADNLSLADLNGITLGAVTTTGTLGVAAVGDIAQAAGTTIAATGATTLASTGAKITLTNATNDFATVNANGTQVSLVDANGMSVALTATGNSSLAAGGDLAVSGTTKDLTTTTTGTGITSFGTTTVAGNLAANSAGAVSQTGVLAVTGTAGFMAAGQDVTLNNTANNFKAVVNVSGANVTLNDMDDLVLGSVTATGKLDATAGAIDLIDAVNADTLALKATTAAVSQTGGTLVVTGQSDLQAATHITLDQANNFNGAVNASGANVTLNDTDALVLAGVIARGNLIVTTGAGNLAGGVTQTGAIVVDGTTQFIANTKIDQEALLTQANDFKGAVSFTGLNDGSWKNLTINDSNTLTLGDVMAGGKLDATATAIDLNGAVNAGTLELEATTGAISQTGGTLVVTGQSDLQAATHITLDQANNFNGAVNASGANVTLNDTDALVLAGVIARGNLIVTTGAGNLAGGVTQTGAIVVDGTTQFIAKTKIDQEVVLTLANDFKGAVSFTGVNAGSWKNLTINDTSTLTLGDVMAGGLLNATATAIDLNGTVDADTLALKATNGAISQTGGALVVTGQSDLRATTDITLNQANDFNDLVNASGANITLNDTDDLVLGSVTTSGNLTVSSNADLNLGTSTVGGALTANSGSGGGNIIQTGPLSVVGDSTLNAGAGNINLSNPTNSLGGVFNASANNVTVADNDGALTLGTVNAAGKLDATAGAIDLIGAVNAGSLDLKATIGAISQTGGTLTVAGQSDLQAATDITLNQANDFVGRVNAQGRNVSLADINDLNLGGITTTGNLQTNNYGALNLGTSSVAGNLLVNSNGGNITASGPLMVAGSTGLYAGSGVIELDNPKNSFGGSVIAQGALVVLASSDSLPSTPPAPVIPAVALPFAAAPLVQTTQSMPQALSDTNVSAVQMFVLQEPSVEQSGVITVLVPREVILLKSSFRFTLPTTIYDVQRKVVDANVTLLDGQPLPAWLRFNAKTGVFSADAIPENAMPLQVRLTVDGQDTVVEISLQEE